MYPKDTRLARGRVAVPPAWPLPGAVALIASAVAGALLVPLLMGVGRVYLGGIGPATSSRRGVLASRGGGWCEGSPRGQPERRTHALPSGIQRPQVTVSVAFASVCFAIAASASLRLKRAAGPSSGTSSAYTVMT